MRMMTLQQAFDWVQQRCPQARLVGDGSTPIARVHTDSRSLQPGDLFVALKGEHFDANDFVPQARAAGAVAAIAHGGLVQAGLRGLEVPDSLLALGALAAGWRAFWPRRRAKLRLPRGAISTMPLACRRPCCAWVRSTAWAWSNWA